MYWFVNKHIWNRIDRDVGGAKVAMRVLVTGAAGMLGSRLVEVVPEGITPILTDKADADLSVPAEVERLFDAHTGMTGVLHVAGFTAVDEAERTPAAAHRDNVTATESVAAACAQRGLPLVMMSTDFVFNGTAESPYRETDRPDPINEYGRSKLAAEQAALAVHAAGTRIVRTQWLYGPHGRHFPGRILELAAERAELTVVSDQIGSPTSTLELAPALWDVLLEGEPGIYHAACGGACSWYELAVATLEEAGITTVRVQPCSSDDLSLAARRPHYSVLDCSRLTALRGRPLADWRVALKDWLAQQ